MAANYFYVKAGLGTRTTGGGLTKQTGSFTALGAASVYAKLADALADSAPPVSGDFICESSAHAYSQASALTYAVPVGVTVLSVSDTACDTYATGASESTTGASAITVDGGRWKGIILSAGGGSGSSININLGTVTNNVLTLLENCKLRMASTGSTSKVVIGTGSGTNRSRIFLLNTDMKFSGTGQGIALQSGITHWLGGSLEAGTSAVNTLVIGADGVGVVHFGELDLSNMATAANILESTVTYGGQLLLRNCRLPASWSGNPGTVSSPNGRAALYNCNAGAVNYSIWEKDYLGEVMQETTIVKSGGASDGTTNFSWKITTSANCGPTMPFYSGELWERLNTTGSSKTATVELVHDTNVAGGEGSGTSFAFTDAEIALEAVYLGSSSYPLGTVTDDGVADPMATPADQASSSVTWTTTGLTTPVKQSLSVTFTPQMAGVLIGRVKATVANKTFYVDPVMTIS